MNHKKYFKNNNEENSKKKQSKKLFFIILLAIILILGISYAAVSTKVTGTKKFVITAKNLALFLDESKATTNILLENALPTKDEEGMKNPSYNFSLVNNGKDPVGYTIYIVEAPYENKTPTSAIRYHYTRDVGNKEITQSMNKTKIEDGKCILETDTIEGGQTYHYSYKMWLDYNAGNEVQNTQYSIHLEIKVIEVEPDKYVSNKAFKSENLGENCKTYDDGTDTFLVGQCSQNYVWYSGKLWRVVLKNNETGAVKMVTDNSMTIISFGVNTTFEDSYADQWLNQEFLPTLHDYQDYLIEDTTWDASRTGFDSTRPGGTATIKRTVGLLNAYEYYTTYDKSNGLATVSTGYLNNGDHWWLMNPNSTNLGVKLAHSTALTYTDPSGKYSIRPSVNVKSNIQIMLGDGTKSNPYRLQGDIPEIIKGSTLLSTRYSGEYITFNNELYRIMDVEDGKTKIIAVDKPTELQDSVYNSGSNKSFTSSTIKTDLENYYQNNVEKSYQAMIELEQLWYLDGDSNYKLTICASYDRNISVKDCEKTNNVAMATIGLPRIGEMFASQITRGVKTRFWILSSDVRYNYVVYSYGELSPSSSPNQPYGARPSMYLKSNVVISKNNTGDGTYEHPYDIELSS